jgi:hypothetical protein
LLGHAFHDLPAAYVYLLGIYLGDGCISQNAKGVAKLRLSMDSKYPGILGGAIAAILAVRPSVVGSQHHPGTASRCTPIGRTGLACFRSMEPERSTPVGSSSPTGRSA